MWRDLALWPLLPGQGLFNELNTSLERFGGSENLRLTTASERVVIDESRDVPVLETAAGRVPIVHASAAVKRILSLSYVITWAWREHKEAAQLQQVEPATGMVLMVDEIESHLHPKWQRTILPALAHNGEQQGRPIQVFVTTHSPLVMASAEPGFDPTKDAWFDFDLIAGRPHVQRRTFVNHGDVSNWLTSEAFDLKTAGSVPAEKALEKARALLQEPSPTLERARQITAELEAAGLKDIDAFWGRWDFFVKKLESSQ
ncbi:MAG: AAA family ATPase [Polyangiaceae bacterium]